MRTAAPRRNPTRSRICAQSGELSMSEPSHPGNEATSASVSQRIGQLCACFEDAWKVGPQPRIEDYLNAVPEPKRAVLLEQLLSLELAYRRRDSQTLVLEDYLRRFPEHAARIR